MRRDMSLLHYKLHIVHVYYTISSNTLFEIGEQITGCNTAVRTRHQTIILFLIDFFETITKITMHLVHKSVIF